MSMPTSYRLLMRHLQMALFPVLAAAFLTTTSPLLKAAKGDAEVIVASDRTEAGRKYTPPTAEKPAYYAILSAGPKDMGDSVAGEKIPTSKDVEPQIIEVLAKQHYLQVDEKHETPSLVIVYSWGSINPDEMESGDPDDPTTIRLNEKQMLAVVATNKLDLSPNSPDRNLFVPDLSSGRYFILVGAYDYESLKKNKKVMLWRTRLSTYNNNVEFAAALPMLLKAGATSFGTDDYPQSVQGKLRKGIVEIGTAEVKEYIPDDTAANDKTDSKATNANKK